MDGLAPTLNLCIEVRMLIERGQALLSGLRQIVPQLPNDLKVELLRVIYQYEQSGGVEFQSDSASIYRQELLRIINAGLCGEPIISRLREIEIEIKSACESEISHFISILPIRALLPLLLIQFPAFLILMLGPIVQEFTRSFTQ